MILLVHFVCDMGHSTHQTADVFAWPLTREQYDELEVSIKEAEIGCGWITITGITPLMD